MARKKVAKRRGGRRGRWLRVLRRGALGVAVLLVLAVAAPAVIDPPATPYMMAESRRLGGVAQDWVPMERIAPVMARAAVAAEDADFCLHWGFDLDAIRAAIASGADRGGSTISQQVVKNVYLWQGRSWPRKALEAVLTPAVEAVWTKRRILEVYLNVAEFGEGVFGVAAAAQAAFGVPPDRLSADQAARLASVLPSPKTRSAARLDAAGGRRVARIADGAAVIAADGRAACFQRDGAG